MKSNRLLKLIKITEEQKENAVDGTNRHLQLQLRLDYLVSTLEEYIYKTL